MNAPDKIYLHPDIGGKGFIRPWLKRAANSESVAYIRKDALLDFLASLEKNSARNAGTDDQAYAAHEMVCLLIDKIKSL